MLTLNFFCTWTLLFMNRGRLHTRHTARTTKKSSLVILAGTQSGIFQSQESSIISIHHAGRILVRGAKAHRCREISPSCFPDIPTTPENRSVSWASSIQGGSGETGKHQHVQSILLGLGLCIFLSPLLGRLDSLCLILLPCLGDIVGEGVVGIGSTKESLNGEENGTNLQCRGPVA